MKNPRLISICLLVFIYFNCSAQNFYIEGPREACLSDCQSYYINLPNGGQGKLLVAGPDGSVGTSCYDLTVNEEINVLCFYCPGTFTLKLNFGGAIIDSLNVNVSPQIDLIIFPKDSLLCQNTKSNLVCPGSTQTYKTNQLFPNSFITWTVNNAKDYKINTDGTITVTWGESGTGSILAFSNTGQVGCISEAAYQVEILETIEVDFSTGGNEFCVGEEIFVEPYNLKGSIYEWDFGNGEKSTDIKPSFSYDAPGTYTVTLFMKNECGCIGTMSKQINVKDKYKPTIDCKSTICEQTEITYTTNTECGKFLWNVIGDGKITSGGKATDKSITVNWGSGPQGLIELKVEACNFDLCLEKSVFEIPIISEKAEISGEVIACQNSYEFYNIQKYGATKYDWTVENGEITAGQGSSGIIVLWNASSKGKIKVKYDNCYLKCGGEDELEVQLKTSYKLTVPQKEYCIGDLLTASALDQTGNPTSINSWKIKDENGNIIFDANNKTNITFTVPIGTSTLSIESKSNDLCNGTQTQQVTVLPKSKAPEKINGELAICKGLTYVYKVEKNIVNANYSWIARDGSINKTGVGDRIIITWNTDGPYFVELQQTDLSKNYCPSNTYKINPKKLDKIEISGNDETCVYDIYESIATYYDGIDYDWEIVPKDAATIVSKENSGVKIIWNKVGTHQIKLSNCAGTFTKNIIVNGLPLVSVNYPNTICENVVTPVNTATSFIDYKWLDSNKNIISTVAVPSIKAGTYICEATDSKGCKNSESFTIKELPKPNVFLSTPDFEGVCLLNPTVNFPTIFALDAEDGYKYEWFKNGLNLGINSNSYLTSSIGKYTVEVTDAFGCKNLSNDLLVYDNCPSGGGNGNPCKSNGKSNLTFTKIDCNSFDFKSTATNFISGSEAWSFGDFSSPTNFVIGSNVDHDFSNAGYYKVSHQVLVDDLNTIGGSCLIDTTVTIEVALKSNFEFINACQGEVIQFYDRSTFIPGKNITSWAWDFGDLASGADNTSSLPDPTHIFSNDGTYTVKLTVSNGTCSEEFTMQVTLHKKLNPLIIDSEAKCEKETTVFKFSDLKDILKSEWNFGNPSSGSNDNQTSLTGFHQYENAGNYIVIAKLKSIYNCSSIVTSTIAIVPNTLAGSIVTNNGDEICEGLSTDLSFSNNAVKWNWSTKENTNTINVKESGIYMVTIADVNGCTFSPKDKIIKVNALPTTSLVSKITKDEILLNDYDQKIEFCNGFNLKIEAIQNANWTYQWLDGLIGTDHTFTMTGPLPNIYNLKLKIKDITTGCFNLIEPIEVKVNGLPADITIASSSAGVLCENVNHVLKVVNNIADVNYKWSNGKAGITTNAAAAGNYFVIGKDENGCEAKSNVIEIVSGPDANNVPAGCFERCAPDSICFPTITNAVSYQWYKNNTALSSTVGGTSAYPIFSESGSYYVEMTGNNGCVSKSEPLNLTLNQVEGVVCGIIYDDINGNGALDAQDTFIKDITVKLASSTAVTDNNGKFKFDKLPANSYTVIIDVSTLPAGYSPNIIQENFVIRTCGDTVNITFTCDKECIPNVSEEKYKLCVEKEIKIGNQVFKTDTLYKELKLIAVGCVDTIKHDIKFAKKLSYNLNTESSCENTNTGSMEIDLQIPNLFTYKVDNLPLFNTNKIGGLGKGLHNLLFTDDIGCKTEVPFDIGVKEVVKYTINTQKISCEKGFAEVSITLENYDVTKVKLTWNTGSLASQIRVDKEGTYNLKIDNGCEIKEENVKVIRETAEKELKKFIICSGNSLDLLGTKFDRDTVFTRTKEAGFCLDTTTYNLQFSPKFDFDMRVEGNCRNEDNGKIFFDMKTKGVFKYDLSGNAVNFVDGFINDLSPNKYKFNIIDEIGCKQTIDVDIMSKEKVAYQLKQEDISCFKGYADIELEFENYSTQELKIKWSNNEVGEAIKISTSGKYSVEINNGCEILQEEFEVKTTEALPSFVIPNVISQGSFSNSSIDLNNTEFKDATIKTFNLFDRSGMLIFAGDQNNKIWDGTLNGNLLVSGVYVYVIEADVDVCGKIENIRKAGTITLVR
jgi:PKD repeat protein